MTESKQIRCEDCGSIIGSLTKTAHGKFVLTEAENDSNCKHPPIRECPSASLARSKARETTPSYRYS
jgi:hypothetical protein